MTYQDWDDDAYDAAESRGLAIWNREDVAYESSREDQFDHAEQLREWADNERKRRRENPELYPAREENHG